MSAFVSLARDVREDQWVQETELDSFYDRDERRDVRLVHKSEGFRDYGAPYTQWTPELWGILYGPDQAVWYNQKRDALDNFRRQKLQAAQSP